MVDTGFRANVAAIAEVEDGCTLSGVKVKRYWRNRCFWFCPLRAACFLASDAIFVYACCFVGSAVVSVHKCYTTSKRRLWCSLLATAEALDTPLSSLDDCDVASLALRIYFCRFIVFGHDWRPSCTYIHTTHNKLIFLHTDFTKKETRTIVMSTRYLWETCRYERSDI